MNSIRCFLTQVVLCWLAAANIEASTLSPPLTFAGSQCFGVGRAATVRHEFGPMPPFLAGEHLLIAPPVAFAGMTDCTDHGAQGGGNDWNVTILNNTGSPVTDLFVVADLNVTFANFDGVFVSGANLLFAKEIELPFDFELGIRVLKPGEARSFRLMDSTNAPTFASVGVPSTDPASTYSIVGNIIPEPSMIELFGFGTLGLLGYGWFRRKRRA